MHRVVRLMDPRIYCEYNVRAGLDGQKSSLRIRITYSDGDATPGTAANHAVSHMAVVQPRQLNAAAAAPPAKGPGIMLSNKSNKPTEYFFYDNYWNGQFLLLLHPLSFFLS